MVGWYHQWLSCWDRSSEAIWEVKLMDGVSSVPIMQIVFSFRHSIISSIIGSKTLVGIASNCNLVHPSAMRWWRRKIVGQSTGSDLIFNRRDTLGSLLTFNLTNRRLLSYYFAIWCMETWPFGACFGVFSSRKSHWSSLLFLEYQEFVRSFLP